MTSSRPLLGGKSPNLGIPRAAARGRKPGKKRGFWGKIGIFGGEKGILGEKTGFGVRGGEFEEKNGILGRKKGIFCEKNGILGGKPGVREENGNFGGRNRDFGV